MAFLPTAHIEGIRNGVFSTWTLDEYVAGSRDTPAPDEATSRHGATTFTDYFLLLKVDGRWLIANKVHHAQRWSGLPSG